MQRRYRALPPLHWLRAFEATARHRSFTEAARELALTQAAVSQQIRQLEARLGTALFIRHARRIELTDAGLAYLPKVQAAFASLDSTTESLFGLDPARPVGLRCPISLASLWLAPRLATLARDLPGVGVNVSTFFAPAQFGEDGIDLEIRYGDGDWPGHVRHRLFRESLVPVASPELMGNYDWTALPLLQVAGAREGWREWFAAAGIPVPPRNGPWLQFDSWITARGAALAGAGVLLGSFPLAQPDIERGALVRLSEVSLEAAQAHWLVHPEGVRLPAPARRLRDWLLAQAGAAQPS